MQFAFSRWQKTRRKQDSNYFCQTTRESSDAAPILDEYKENKENVKISIESEENEDAENENQNPLDHHLFSDDLLDSTKSTENTPNPSFAIMARK